MKAAAVQTNVDYHNPTAHMTRSLKATSLIWLTVPILLIGVTIRIINVMDIPFFSDEAWHLIRAHRILNGVPFAGFDQNKWFYGYVVSWFNPTGPEGPWIARYVNVLWAAISISAAVAIGRLLDRRGTGLLAGLIYAVVPLATFHERQALTDPQVAALAAISIIFAIQLARPESKHNKWWYVAGLAISMALARATKPSILPFYALPLWGILLFALPKEGFSLKALFADWQKLVKPVLMAMVAVAIVLLSERVMIVVANSTGVLPRDQNEISSENTILADLDDPVALRENLTEDLTVLADIIVRYVGPAGALLMVAGLALALTFKDRWREALFILAPAILFMAVPVIATPPTATGEIATRYVLINTVSISVFIALGLSMLLARLNQYQPQLAPAVAVIAVVLIVGQSLWFNARLISDPWQIAWNKYDQRVYFEDTTSGYYHIPLIERLEDEWNANARERQHTIGGPKAMLWVQSYMGPRVGEFKSILYDSPEQAYQIALWLEQGEEVFLVETPEELSFEPGPNGTELEYMTEWESLFGEQRLYRVVGARDGLAEEVYNLLGDEPEFMQADHQALVDSINGEGIQHVVVYPYDHAPFIADMTDARVEALPLETWPLSQANVSEALAQLKIPQGERYAVIVYDPPVSDPQRMVPLTLVSNDYLLGDEQWSGRLRLQRYIAADEAGMEPIDAVFEDAIQLDSASINVANDAVLIETEWQTRSDVVDSFFVFTHVLAEDGTLVAQRDGIPGAGLFPLTEWHPGEAITDRYAIQLPDGLPAGRYEVHVGIYEPNSGLRLRITEGSDSPDSVLLTTIEFQPNLSIAEAQ